MVYFALLSAIFSFLIFFLGLVGYLPAGPISFLTLVYLLGAIALVLVGTEARQFYREIAGQRGGPIFIFASLLFLQALVNLLGVLGPELAFDALWYHLTLPKIYLNESRILFLSGGLYYYSAMPKLVEALYLGCLTLAKSGILAKLLHFIFGWATTLFLYHTARQWLNKHWSLTVALLFYTALVVGWESITAYVDLGWVFYQFLSFVLLLAWCSRPKREYLTLSGIMQGLALAVKLPSIMLWPIMLFLVWRGEKKIKSTLVFCLTGLLVASPWWLFSYLSTGNPIYPLLTSFMPLNISFSGREFVNETFRVLTWPQDPFSPVFLIFLPVLLYWLIRKRLWTDPLLQRLALFGVGGYLGWFLFFRTSGSRFLLPLLPVWSLIYVLILAKSSIYWQRTFGVIIVLISLINIGYRALANWRFLPVIVGSQTRSDFLAARLNFAYGDFYDIDGELGRIIQDERVLVYGGHNLFYADFLFAHESYARPGQYFAYVLTQGTILPRQYGHLELVYTNTDTKVSLYRYGGEFRAN